MNILDELLSLEFSDSKEDIVLKKHMNRAYGKIQSDIQELITKIQDVKEMGYTTSLIFHGGCHGCKAVKEETLSTCYDCYYFRWDGAYEDKSLLYQDDKVEEDE